MVIGLAIAPVSSGFFGASSVIGLLPQDAALTTQDADGSLHYGRIDELSLVRPGEYRIAG